MNQLASETSPYLLQHAQNPVNWLAWNPTSLKKALDENKPIILSIGYSACHWCHVMEHESFENEAVASIMNQYFICIKVDREERPDVDSIYMDAVQAMGIRGGWPLNMFLMPDAKPFYGGTYFPPNKWASICQNIAETFQKNNEELQKSANGFAQHLHTSDIEKYNLELGSGFRIEDIELIVNKLSENFDQQWGGMNKAPKFPMPSIWLFLTDYLLSNKNQKSGDSSNQKFISDHLKLTLNKMAMGGIYDQIGGGFARYSVDNEWFCPHFEKMLYDNAQLLSLYSKAYLVEEDNLLKETVFQSINWLKREILTPEGAFHSAQDADSEGVEGKFYIWEKSDIENILQEKTDEFCKDFQISEVGNWEHGQNILWKSTPFLNSKYNHEIAKLLEVRNQRVFPGLDNKILCSWNALVINGLVDSFQVFGVNEYKTIALNCGNFILENFYKKGYLLRTYSNGQAKIEGFLEDYAATISAFIKLYQISFDMKWLSHAETLLITTLSDFFDENDHFFYFSNKKTSELIANKKEIFDNVIPCSNSIMAHILYDLGVYLSKNELITLSETMLSKMKSIIVQNPEYLSNWASLALKLIKPKVEIVIIGPNYKEISSKIKPQYWQTFYIHAAEKEEILPAFTNRQPPNSLTYIYVCINNTCSMPLQEWAEFEAVINEVGY